MYKKENGQDISRRPKGLMLWNRFYGRIREEDSRDALWALAAGTVVALGMWLADNELDPNPSTLPSIESPYEPHDEPQGLIQQAGALLLASLSGNTSVAEAEHRQDY